MSKQLTPEVLHHLATCDEGGLRWMTGRCMPAGYASVELYAMPGFGRAPALVLKADADARIAELEGVLAKALAFTEANTFGGTDALALIEECHAALASKQQAEPATPSEDGGEVITDIADLFADSKCAICGDTGHFVVDDTGPEYVTSPCPECNAPDAWRMFDGEGGYDYTHDEETAGRWKKHCGEKYASWVEPLYLSAPSGSQHSRIVAAKDAEIARLKADDAEAIKRPPYAHICIGMPAALHHDTRKLLERFTHALAVKLRAAEEKYGYSNGWKDAGWMDECRAKLAEHMAKGDPRDVAAYCAFLWNHGESTAQPARQVGGDGRVRRVLLLTSYCGDDSEGCTDATPCAECLKMCNVALTSGDMKVIGGFGSQAALAPAVSQVGDEPIRDDDLVLVPRGLLGAARYAIKNKVDAPNVHGQLGEYCYGQAALAPAAKEDE